MAEKRSNKVLGPQILWDAATREIEIRLPPMHKTGPAIETGWRQEIIYVVRIRESGTKPWSVGFETPLMACGFDGLKPSTDYEVEICAKDKDDVTKIGPIVVRTPSMPNGTAKIRYSVNS